MAAPCSDNPSEAKTRPAWRCGRSVAIGGEADITRTPLLRGYRRMDQSEVEDLPLRGDEELWNDEGRCLHVRKRGRSPGRQSLEEGKASLTKPQTGLG